MNPFFKPNISAKGRLIRLIGALALLTGGVLLGREIPWAGVVMILSGGFVLFEAARGWCALRACGIKTKF